MPELPHDPSRPESGQPYAPQPPAWQPLAGQPAVPPAFPSGQNVPQAHLPPPAGQPVGPPTGGELPAELPADVGAHDRTQSERHRHAQQRPVPGLDSQGHVKSTRVSSTWVGLIVAALVLILLLIFIGQNLQHVTIHYLGFSGSMPVAIALLLAAVMGALLLAVPGTLRILQLRRGLKKAAEQQQAKR